MPGRDGTGPLGKGAATGRGLGFCTTGARKAGMGLGLGLGLGRRRGLRGNYALNDYALNNKEAMREEKSILERRLQILNDQLNDM